MYLVTERNRALSQVGLARLCQGTTDYGSFLDFLSCLQGAWGLLKLPGFLRLLLMIAIRFVGSQFRAPSWQQSPHTRF